MNSFPMKMHHTPLIQFIDPLPAIKLIRIDDLYKVVQLRARNRKTNEVVVLKEMKVPRGMKL